MMLTEYCKINGFIRIQMILFSYNKNDENEEESESKIKINGTIVENKRLGRKSM